MRYFLSLGSNLGDKRKNLAQALDLLIRHGVRILRVSAIYRTQPVGDPGQPWFYNQAVEVQTTFRPASTLKLIKKIETQLGRTQTVSTGPRPIDIDILLAENSIIRSDDLVIPHPRLDKRNFVLIPLEEIAPEAVHPGLRKSISTLRRESSDRSVVRRLKPSRGQIAR
jgi:2-amino-4-hydroxy-6-hydroxymethyldihydropteridine diphosphokinase